MKKKKITFCPVDDINKNPLSKKECDGYYSSQFNYAGVFNGSVWNDYYGVIYLINDTNKDKFWNNIMVYIGQTIQTLRKRFYDDLNSPSNKYLKATVERYDKKFEIIEIDSNHYRTKGGEFTIEIIKKCKTLKELNKSEKKEIQKHKSYIPKYHKYIGGKIIPLYGYNLYKGGGGRMPLKGRLHPFYVHINKDALKDIIVSGYLTYEIANEFGVTRAVINNRIKEFWGNQGIRTLKDVRAKFGGQELYNERKKQIVDESRHMERIKQFYIKVDASLLDKLLEEDLTSIDIDEIFLEKLIFIGYKKKRIQDKIGLSGQPAKDRLKNIFGFENFQQARDEMFFLPRLIPLLKEGLTINEILNKFNTKLTPELEVGITAIKSALRRIWKHEYEYYEQFSENNITDVDDVSHFRYPSNPFREFLLYLHRLYRVYPKINSDITETLTGSTTNPEEVDSEFLKYMLYQNKNIEKIMQIIDRPRKWTSGWFKSILGMDYNTAKYEYYWRPRILEILKDSKCIPTGGEVAQKLMIEQGNLGRVLKKAFPKEMSKVLSIKELFEELKKNFIKD